jgi:non-specific serine/threonine protein kinase/serine/threonine-protein kinase
MSDQDFPTQPLPPSEDEELLSYASDSLPLKPDDQIGPYRLHRRLGEGGMGVVWLAEQQKPINRRVALKIIKVGMDSRRVVARFATERQVLARLDHPNFARVYDAGTTETGRPYFAMEYVHGMAITDYCDKHQLDTNQRIELFLKVCEGVQYAHQNAIIHRDLKPHNVLVTVKGDQAIPKIIDFGVAKATDQRQAEHTVFTQLGHFIGTPEYMSPEQADVSDLDIDTRTDIYSLGVLLYELFTGQLPFDSKELRRQGIDEIRRRIKEDDPLPPSARVSHLGPKTEAVAQRHSTSPAKLAREVRGDLDWITMKAMEKDRARRYASPKEMADDLRRHLKNEPVLASPPSVSYRTQKFVRRHTVGVLIAAISTAMLIAFAATMTVQAERIARERDRANTEAETSRQVSEFLVKLFDISDPSESKGNSITAREILDAGAERVQKDLSDQPATRATMMRTMGRVYTELSLFSAAEPLVKQAVELAENDPTVDDLELAAGLYELAKLYSWTDRATEGVELASRSLAIREERLGPNHPEVAQSLNALGNCLQRLDRLDEAAAAHERALHIREQAPGENSEAIASSVHNLAIVYYFKGDLDRAAQLYQRSAEMDLRSQGRDNHNYATSLHTLAIVYKDQGKLEEALELELESLEIREKVLGPDHAHVGFSLSTLGEIYRELGRPVEGEQPGRRALVIAETTQGVSHPETAWTRGNLVLTLLALDKIDEAEAVVTEAIAGIEATGDEEALPGALDELGEIRRRQTPTIPESV